MKDNNKKRFCLNCQTELQGGYCHVCGQKATRENLTIKEFILEYMNIAFIWDAHFLKTIWQLLRRPGYLTNEYVSGKFVSYTHPLKLNMFLLFVFITFFLLFHNAEDLGNSVQNFTRDEVHYPMIQIQLLANDDQYAAKLESSPIDTVHLYAPLALSDEYPDIVVNLDPYNTASRDSMVVWTAALPHVLIEDKYIVPDAHGCYYFTEKETTSTEDVRMLESVWKQMVTMTTRYFPIIILLTVPFLTLLMRVGCRRGMHSHFKHFIFSLHYTAFLELLILTLYIAFLIVSPPAAVMQSVMLIGSYVYLTIAIKRAYETKGWLRAFCRSVFVNAGYAVILLLLLIFIVVVSTLIVVFKTEF